MQTRKIKATTAVAGAVAGVIGIGAAVAIAAPGGSSDGGSTQTAQVTSGTAAPANRPKTSPELRAQVISQVALFRQPATADDAAPKELVPPTETGSPLNFGRDDLSFGRRLPGVPSTWLIPIETGGIAKVSSKGGAEFTPEQLQAGQVVSATTAEDGTIIVAGLVPDGTKSVSIDTANGGSVPAELAGNTYAKSFDPSTLKADRPVSVTVASTGSNESKTAKLAGFAADGTITP